MKPVVVKLGGSLAQAGTLRSWLSIAAHAERATVIVPGGGICADAVRELQTTLGLEDSTAHDMAILAMEQVGRAFIELEPRLIAADTLDAIYHALQARRIPVWMPSKMCTLDRRIPRDWSITSDGLAARLAEQLASDVALIKSTHVPQGHTAHDLASEELIDIVFAEIVERSHLTWHAFGPADKVRFAQIISSSDSAGKQRSISSLRPLPSTRPRHHARAR